MVIRQQRAPQKNMDTVSQVSSAHIGGKGGDTAVCQKLPETSRKRNFAEQTSVRNTVVVKKQGSV